MTEMMEEFLAERCGIYILTMDALMDTLEYLDSFGLHWLSGKPASSPNFITKTFTLPISIFYHRPFEGLFYDRNGDSQGKRLVDCLEFGVFEKIPAQYQPLDMTCLFE